MAIRCFTGTTIEKLFKSSGCAERITTGHLINSQLMSNKNLSGGTFHIVSIRRGLRKVLYALRRFLGGLFTSAG